MKKKNLKETTKEHHQKNELKNHHKALPNSKEARLPSIEKIQLVEIKQEESIEDFQLHQLEKKVSKLPNENYLYRLFRSTDIKTVYDKKSFTVDLNNLYPFNKKIVSNKGYETDTYYFTNNTRQIVIRKLWSLFIVRNFIYAMMEGNFEKIIEEYDKLPNDIRSNLNIIHYTYKDEKFNINNRKSDMLQFLHLLHDSLSVDQVLELLDRYLPEIKKDPRFEPFTFSIKYSYIVSTWAKLPAEKSLLDNDNFGFLYKLEKEGVIKDRFFMTFMMGALDEEIKLDKLNNIKVFDKASPSDNKRHFFRLSDLVHIIDRMTARFPSMNKTAFYRQVMDKVMDLFHTPYILPSDDESKENIKEILSWIDERRSTYPKKIRRNSKSKYFIRKSDVDEFISIFGNREFIRNTYRAMYVRAPLIIRKDPKDMNSEIIWEGIIKRYDTFYLPAPTNLEDIKRGGDSNIFKWMMTNSIRMTENILTGEKNSVEHVSTRNISGEETKTDRYGISIEKTATIMGIAPNTVLERRKNEKRFYIYQKISKEEYDRLVYLKKEGEVDVYVTSVHIGEIIDVENGQIQPKYEYYRYMASERVGNNSTVGKRFRPLIMSDSIEEEDEEGNIKKTKMYNLEGSTITVSRHNHSRKRNKTTTCNGMRPETKLEKKPTAIDATADLVDGGTSLDTDRYYFDSEKMELLKYRDAEEVPLKPTTNSGRFKMKEQAAYQDSYALLSRSHISSLQQLQLNRRVSNVIELMKDLNLHKVFTKILQQDIINRVKSSRRHIGYAIGVVGSIPDEQLIYYSSNQGVFKAIRAVKKRVEDTVEYLNSLSSDPTPATEKRTRGILLTQLLLNLKFLEDILQPELNKLPKELKDDIKLINNNKDFYGRDKLIKETLNGYPLVVKWKKINKEQVDSITGEYHTWKEWKLTASTNSERNFNRSRTFSYTIQQPELINRLSFIDFLWKIKDSKSMSSTEKLIRRVCGISYLNFDHLMLNFINANTTRSNRDNYRGNKNENNRKMAS